MSLTVPKAGVIAGRSASIQIATPQVGDAIASFGDAMVKIGDQRKAEALQFEGAKTQLAITREMGQARLEVEQIGNPDEIAPAWEARKADITARYITPEMDPELAKQVGLTIGELDNRHALALGEKVVNLSRSERVAQWITARAEIETEATRADPETVGALVQYGEDQIDAQVAAGLTDPATAATDKQAFRGTVYDNRLLAQIEDDPEAALAALQAGQYDLLGADAITSRSIAAQQEIDRRAVAAAKAVEVQTKAEQDAIGAQLTTYIDVLGEGRIAANEALMADPRAKTHPKYFEALAAKSLSEEQPGLMLMTPAELTAQIAAEESRPVAHKYQTERLKVLRDMQAKQAALWNTDPKAAGRKAKLPVPPKLEFDPEEPDTFARTLAESLSFDAWSRKAGYTSAQAIFDPAEKAALKTVLDPKADAAPKVALAKAILQGTGGKPDRVATALEADPVFRRTTRLLADTGSEGLATSVLRGQQKAEMKTVILPTGRDQARLFDEITQGAFDGAPALKAELMAASVALYADGAAGVDAEAQSGTGWMEDDTAVMLFTDAVQRITGSTADDTGALTIGGLQTVNGAMVTLPAGVPVAQVEDTLEKLGDQLNGWEGSNAAPAVPGSTADVALLRDQAMGVTRPAKDPLRGFKAASLYKGAPDLGPDPSARLQSLTLSRVGETDVYEFRYSSGGRSYPLAQTNGITYRFRLADLMREASR